MSIVNPNNGNETKSDAFLWDILKSNTNLSLSKNINYFSDFQNRNFSILLRLKWNQAIELRQNQTFFRGTYSNLTLFFIGRKILKYFNDFCNWHFCVNLTVFSLIYIVVHYLNHFWNLFLNKIYLKNDCQQMIVLHLIWFQKC